MTSWTEEIALVRNNKGQATIRKATKDDNPAAVFTVEQLPDLFATLRQNKVEVSADNFMLVGTEKREDGRGFKAIQAKKQRSYKDKEGATRQANDAYAHEQILAFTPVDFACSTKWGTAKNGKKFPLPLFIAYAVPREQVTQAAPRGAAFTRSTAQTEAETPLARGKA